MSSALGALGFLSARVEDGAYVALLVPSLLALLAGAALGFAVYLGRISSRLVVWLAASAIASAAWFGMQWGRIDHDRREFAAVYAASELEGLATPEEAQLLLGADPSVGSPEISHAYSLFLREQVGQDGLRAEVALRLRRGVRVLGESGFSVSEGVAAAFLAFEGLWMLLLTAAIALPVARTRTCPTCGAWVVSRRVAQTSPADVPRAIELLAQGLSAPRGRGAAIYEERCPRCPEDTRTFVHR